MSRLPHSNAHLFQGRRRQGGSGGHGAAPDMCAAACAVPRGQAKLPVARRLRAAASWGDECRINGELSSVPEGHAIAHDLNPPGVADRNINVHVSDTNIARDSSAGFAADAGEGVLER